MNDKLNVKIKAIGLLDLLAFKKLVPNRKKRIQNAPATRIKKVPPMNALAARMHPKLQNFTITDVVPLAHDMKLYELSGDFAAYFRAGQYLSVKLNIDGYKVTRPYSILSSPKDSLSNKYMLGIKKTQGGFVSEYIYDNWKKGDIVQTSGPEGNFYYEPLRDAKTVVGIAGGCGITPFYSMAKAISEGTEDFNLCLLYGCRTSKDIALKKEFDDIEKATNGKVKVVYILSDEQKDGCESGFITKQIISKYAQGKYSIFMCGPQEMYNFARKEIEQLGLAKKFVRRELFGQINNIADYEPFPKEEVGQMHKLIIRAGKETFETQASSTESVLVAIERAKVLAPSRCRTGQCGFCRSRLISGDVFIPEDNDGRRMADKKFGYIHPCSSFPISDIEIEII